MIEKNDEKLRECVLRHAAAWNGGRNFIAWIESANQFVNTLVDRIVPGYPGDRETRDRPPDIHSLNGMMKLAKKRLERRCTARRHALRRSPDDPRSRVAMAGRTPRHVPDPGGLSLGRGVLDTP